MVKSWQTNDGYDIFRVLSGRSNAYLVVMDTQAILVDTGPAPAWETLQRNIDLCKPVNGLLSFLILTHTHFDHCQNAHRIKARYNCKIIVSDHEQAFVTAGYTPLPKGTFFFTRYISKLGNSLGKVRFGYHPFTPDQLLKNEMKLKTYGPEIEIIATPGHSPGSISVLVNREIAIVGDAMFGIFRNSIFPPFADDQAAMIRSWGKLLETRCRMYLPGHGGPVGRELLKREYSRYLKKFFT